MNRYELAVYETQSVISEWMGSDPLDQRRLAQQIVERLIAKGVIQSTDPDDLIDYRTGPLKPGRIITGGE